MVIVGNEAPGVVLIFAKGDAGVFVRHVAIHGKEMLGFIVFAEDNEADY